MISFYTLPSTVMHHPTHKQLKAAYSFYNVSEKTPLVDLMRDALILAKQVRTIRHFRNERGLGRVNVRKDLWDWENWSVLDPLDTLWSLHNVVFFTASTLQL